MGLLAKTELIDYSCTAAIIAAFVLVLFYCCFGLLCKNGFFANNSKTTVKQR